jgi:hypothetical protein
MNLSKLTGRPMALPLLGFAGLCFAAPLFGPDGPLDLSAYRDVVVASNPLEGPEHMYETALEGGPTGHIEDSQLANVRPGAGADGVPSGGPPSPLFGAGSWEQSLLRFEEFGPQAVAAGDPEAVDFPLPPDTQTRVDGAQLDEFLTLPMWPEPTLLSAEGIELGRRVGYQSVTDLVSWWGS